MNRNLTASRIHLIAGKGGVGKTLLSWALAHYFASNRHRTLFVELASEDANDQTELEAPLVQEKPNFWRIKIYADQALYEYLKLKIGSEKLLNKLWSHQLFRALGAAMPGLADLTRLGKIWFHADGGHALKQEQIFDKIVVDMPSSGFVKRFLSVARVVAEAVKIGPIAHEARSIQNYMKNPANALLHLIVLPEELIVNESLELFEELKDEQDLSLGGLFINRVNTLNTTKASHVPANLKAVNAIVNFFAQKKALEKRELERLKSIPLQHILIEEQFGEVMLSPILDTFCTHLKLCL